MIPTCYTTKEELALMERQGMGLMYDRLRGDEAIALYSEGRVNDLARTAKELVAHWMLANEFATGDGDTIEDLLAELTWQVNELKGAV